MNVAPEDLQRLDLEQLHELQAKVDQDRLLLQQLRDTLEQEQQGRGDGCGARQRAHDVHRRINNDEASGQPPIFNRASQNVAAAAMLVRAMPEPSTTEGRRVHGELRGLLKTAAVQQAESSTSRRCGDASKQPSVHDRLRAPSVHDRLRAASVHDRLDDQCEAQNGHHVGSRRRRHGHDGAARGYQLH